MYYLSRLFSVQFIYWKIYTKTTLVYFHESWWKSEAGIKQKPIELPAPLIL